jgi:glycosyltransferase involved in cell wall biosynthesis
MPYLLTDMKTDPSNNRTERTSEYSLGIDGFSLSRKDSGIEVYTRELVKGVLSQQCKVELYNYRNFDFPNHKNLTKKNSGYAIEPPQISKLYWELSGINKLISNEVEIFHSPHFILPFNDSIPKRVVTVHDLAFIKCPHFFDWKTKLYYRLFLKRSLQVASAIICISQSCMEDVLEHFPFTAKKLFKVYNGFKDFSLIGKDESILSDLALRSPFVLMIGTLNSRKNLVNGIAAFEKVSAKKDLELVITGNLNQYALGIARQNPKIKFTGYIDDAKLSALYKNASVLLYPSHYEGFGLPVLEAMSVGLPVVTSNNSSLPEISGYAPELLCNSLSINDIAQKLNIVLTDVNRNDIAAHGFGNIKKFSWQKMVSDTLEVYGQI